MEAMPSRVLKTPKLKNLLIKKILTKVGMIVPPYPRLFDFLALRQPLGSALISPLKFVRQPFQRPISQR